MLQAPFFSEIQNSFEVERQKRIQNKNKDSFTYQTNDNYVFSNTEEETVGEKNLVIFLEKIFSDYLVYSNPYLDGIGELCDVLVIFKNHIFIFSDKNKEKFNNIPLKKAWKNFYSNIKKSENQLNTAYNNIFKNIQNNILKITNNRKDQTFEVFIENNPIVHLITTISGIDLFTKNYKDSCDYLNPDGSLPIDHSKKQNNEKILATVNKINEHNILLHSIDTKNLENISIFFNTPIDFTNYLTFREHFFIDNKDENFILKNEKELIAVFLFKENPEIFEKTIKFKSGKKIFFDLMKYQKNDISNYDTIISKCTYFNDLLHHTNSSKFIDDLLQYICYTGNQTNSGFLQSNLTDLEYRKTMYTYLSLNRKERIAIYLDINEYIHEIEQSGELKNFVKCKKLNQSFYLYCFYLYDPQKHSSLEVYRQQRVNFLIHKAQQLKNKNLGSLKLYVFGFDHLNSFYQSNTRTNAIDLIYLEL